MKTWDLVIIKNFPPDYHYSGPYITNIQVLKEIRNVTTNNYEYLRVQLQESVRVFPVAWDLGSSNESSVSQI